MSLTIALIIIVIIFIIGFRVHNKYERTNEAEARKDKEDHHTRYQDALVQLVRTYESTLYAKKLQTMRRDAYGNVFDDLWHKEKVYFYEHVVKLRLSETLGLNEVEMYPYEDSSTSFVIETVIEEFTAKHPTHKFDVNSLTPYEFEAFCTQLLTNSGWSARTTKGSGDQGIDIIGEKDGITAVFQVKQYSSPVGNKAVQEAIAGKAFASADLAFVVSNAGFTPSAVELANVSGVKLLHYTELTGLTVKL